VRTEESNRSRLLGAYGSDVVSGRDPFKIWPKTIDNLATSKPGDVQRIAASQLEMLAPFYSTALEQARTSFRWALRGAVAGILFFMAAIAVLLATAESDAAIVSAIAGAVVEVVAGINFILYGKATTQLSGFHARLEQTQRFLLANSICESITDESAQTDARRSLITTISTHGSATVPAPPRD
jgi:hypothetical protein